MKSVFHANDVTPVPHCPRYLWPAPGMIDNSAATRGSFIAREPFWSMASTTPFACTAH
jgi:hypothetical protein